MRLLALAGAFVLGALLADRWAISVPGLALLAVAALLGAFLLASLRRPLLLALVLLTVTVGALRVEALQPDTEPPLISYHGPARVQLEGVVASDPASSGGVTTLRLGTERIDAGGGWVDATGDMLVSLRAPSDLALSRGRPYFRYGDRLSVEGRLEAPEPLDDFDYPAYLARQGITSVMSFPEATLIAENEGNAFYGRLYAARQRLARSLEQAVPEPQASVGQALLLGIRDGLPDGLVDDFRRTGTSHVLAISGLHVGIMLVLSLGVSTYALGRRHHLYLLAPATLVWLYALISGLSPSATRAAIMASVYLFALLVGRPRSVLPALGLAAAVMVALEPAVLFSVSFQLSFAAVAGIATLAGPLSRLLTAPFSISETGPESGRSALRWLLARGLALMAVSVVATLATLPLVAFSFERISLVGVVTTMLVLPALPLIVVFQGAAASVGVVSVAFGQLLGAVAWVPTWYVTATVAAVAKLPGASFETGPVAPFLVWGYYGTAVVVFAAVALMRRNRRLSVRVSMPSLPGPIVNRRVSWWLAGLAISLAALTWAAALSLPDDRLHVTFVDVGQGDGIFITTPSGRQMVIDGGPDPLEMVRFLGANMPPRDRTLDVVVLTHPHSDHVSGLIEVLQRYDVALVLERGIEYDSAPYATWRRAIDGGTSRLIQAEAGQTIAMGDGVVLRVVSPPDRLLRGTASDVDNASVALRLEYGEVSFLLTGDMFEEGEATLARSGAPLDADVLKVAHHGSRSSSSGKFLDAVSPAVAVISAGIDNRFGHPHDESIVALGEHLPGELMLLTSERGTIEFATDGQRLTFSTER